MTDEGLNYNILSCFLVWKYSFFFLQSNFSFTFLMKINMLEVCFFLVNLLLRKYITTFICAMKQSNGSAVESNFKKQCTMTCCCITDAAPLEEVHTSLTWAHLNVECTERCRDAGLCLRQLPCCLQDTDLSYLSRRKPSCLKQSISQRQHCKYAASFRPRLGFHTSYHI